MNNSENTWCQHYGFTTYRPDEKWTVGKLPEYHYLSFQQVGELLDANPEATWVSEPDFYLPSLNIHNAVLNGDLNEHGPARTT